MQKIYYRISQQIFKHSKLWIGLITLITIFLAFGLSKIQMKMGNDVFVSSSSKVYQDSQRYQKQFGGDSVYLLLSGNQNNVISHHTLQKVAHFDHQVAKIDNVRNTTDVVSTLNEELQKAGSSNSSAAQLSLNSSSLQKDLMNELTTKQKQKLQTALQNSLSTTQQQQVSTYTMSLLTTAQKQQLVQASNTSVDQNQLIQQSLTKTQQSQLQTYTMGLLNSQQQKKLVQVIVPMLPKVQNMSTDLLRDIFLNDQGHVRSQLKQLLPHNGRNMLIIVNTNEKSSDMNTAVQINQDVQQAVKDSHFDKGVKTRIAGQPAIMGQVKGKVITSMGVMLGFAVLLMIVILGLIFPVRRRLLPLGFVLACLVWTFGLMGWLKIPLTLATMATLPIIIGLGTDFGVQFQNRYEEEYRNTHDPEVSITHAVSNMGPAVGVALIIMIFSFLTMYLSKAPLMQQFGLTLAIGVFCSYVVEFSLIFSTLSLLDKRLKPVVVNSTAKLKQPSRLSLLLSRYANFVIKHAAVVMVIGVLLGGLGFTFEKQIGIETDIAKMIPQNMPSLKNTKYLQHRIGSTTYLTYIVESDNGHDLRNHSQLNTIDQLGKHVNDKYSNVVGVTSISTAVQQSGQPLPDSSSALKSQINQLPTSMRQTLISSNYHSMALQFKVKSNLSSKQQLVLMNKINRDIKGTHNHMQIAPAGAQIMMLLGINNMGANHGLIIIAGLSIIFLLLLLIYRNWRLALYPVVPILLVLGLSPLTLHLLGISYNPVTITLSSLVLGIGIEFTILILERYREEMQRNVDTKTAIISSIASVGQAITVSGLTVIGGFSAILFSSFPVLKTFGLITVLDTAYSLISALTILPAFIYLLRKKHK